MFFQECPSGSVSCLGLYNLDWYFNMAYLTCTADTGSCYDVQFHYLLTFGELVMHKTTPHTRSHFVRYTYMYILVCTALF